MREGALLLIHRVRAVGVDPDLRAVGLEAEEGVDHAGARRLVVDLDEVPVADRAGGPSGCEVQDDGGCGRGR